ncbi:hypothetical protein [Prosthecobacter sp.]|uniref:hypothetical protein n=1 Tax=Prosthecobacter sp. TaxID=1965333 RepID=UPI003783D8AC
MITETLLAELADLIRREQDVKTLLRLEPYPVQPGRFVYLIETPFESFPRFVCGTTDPTNSTVFIKAKSFRRESCEEEFTKLMGGSAQP